MTTHLKTAAFVAALAGLALAGMAQEGAAAARPIQTGRHAYPTPNQMGVPTPADRTRTITLREDRDQNYMTTKVYQLKHTIAADLRPFVEGAVFRANPEGNVSRLTYAFGKTNFLSVHMPIWLVPYIDDMVAKLDRPGTLDAEGSVIAGSGIYRFTYMPRHRSSQALFDLVVTPRFISGDGIQFRDPVTNRFYWKDSKSDGEDTLKWVTFFDRPVPQVELVLRVYEISDSDIRELGIDYVAWKNGPGADIFNAGGDFLDVKSFSDTSSKYNPLDISSYASHSWTGFLVAPNIDATFIRLLAQKGKGTVASSARLTVVNDWNNMADAYGNVANPGSFATARYRIQLEPQYQAITKDGNQQITVAAAAAPRFQLYLRNPVINFNPEANQLSPVEKSNDWSTAQAAVVNFGWVLSVRDTVVEQSNTGNDVANDYDFRSQISLATGTEKLLASYTKTYDTEQTNGVIGLSRIPGLKYLFGSEATATVSTRVFITVSASPVKPETDLSPWAARVIEHAEEVVVKK
jgi:hypothetical protein